MPLAAVSRQYMAASALQTYKSFHPDYYRDRADNPADEECALIDCIADLYLYAKSQGIDTTAIANNVAIHLTEV